MRTIKARLTIAIFFLCVMTAAIAGVGYYAAEVSHDGLKTVFNDRVVPLRDLKAVADYYAVNIVDAAHKTRNGNISWDQGIKYVTEASEKLKEKWKAYSQTYMPPEEKRLAAATNEQMKISDAATEELLKILKAHDKTALDKFVIEKLYNSIDPVSDLISKLVNLQISVAQNQYDQSEETFVFAEMSLIIILFAAVGATVFSMWITFFAVIILILRLQLSVVRMKLEKSLNQLKISR
ncbi:MAG: MCP four helix bundle domain-containing protein [Alphaproteobacteria bacterium]